MTVYNENMYVVSDIVMPYHAISGHVLFFLFFLFDSLRPINNPSVIKG